MLSGDYLVKIKCCKIPRCIVLVNICLTFSIIFTSVYQILVTILGVQLPCNHLLFWPSRAFSRYKKTEAVFITEASEGLTLSFTVPDLILTLVSGLYRLYSVIKCICDYVYQKRIKKKRKHVCMTAEFIANTASYITM